MNYEEIRDWWKKASFADRYYVLKHSGFLEDYAIGDCRIEWEAREGYTVKFYRSIKIAVEEFIEKDID